MAKNAGHKTTAGVYGGGLDNQARASVHQQNGNWSLAQIRSQVVKEFGRVKTPAERWSAQHKR